MSGSENEKITGQEAVEKISNSWRAFRAGEPPIEQVNIKLGEEGSSPAEWDDGTVTVAERITKGRYGTSSLERELFEQMEEAFEDTIENEIQNQKQVLENRFSFLDDFGISYNGVQVADLDGKGAHLGHEVSKGGDILNGTNFIVVDYSYFPWIDPLEDEVVGPAEQTVRHETVHALQKYVNSEFDQVWGNTGSRDIGRATTEGMARYEEYKGTNVERKAEKAVQNPERIPDFWRENILDEELEESDPYSYGEFAAYFLEGAFRQKRMNEISEETPARAVHLPTLNKQVESEVRETLVQNPDKESLDSVLSEAGEHLDFPFYGELVDEEYSRMKGYLECEAEFTENLASSGESPNLGRKLEGEDAVERALEKADFTLRHDDHSISEYHRAEARLLATERLEFTPDTYDELQNTVIRLQKEDQDYSRPVCS